jgi:hypothetical protein
VVDQEEALANGKTDIWSLEVGMRLRLKLSVVLAAMGVMLVGIAVAEDDPIRIGALMALTGGLGPYGPSMADGAQMAVDTINAAGGTVMSSSHSLTRPESGLRNRVGRLRSVVFPAPLGPMRPVIVPFLR